MLQTAEYARSILEANAILHGVTASVDDAVLARMKRQELLYRQDKRFHFVVTEAALRVRRVDRSVMLGQLDRLVSLSTLPNVRLGIIGFETRYTVGPRHGFWLRDDKQVSVETYSAALRLTQSAEIELYGKVFEQLSSIASYDRAARAIITRLADDLATEWSAEEGDG